MQAQLESERKASRAVLADEQEGKRKAQVSWRSAVCCACWKLCFFRKPLQHSMCNAYVPILLQAALAEQDLANQKLQTALIAVRAAVCATSGWQVSGSL